jgi:hypothetical protein
MEIRYRTLQRDHCLLVELRQAMVSEGDAWNQKKTGGHCQRTQQYVFHPASITGFALAHRRPTG